MKIKKLILGAMQTNCYVVVNELNDCFIVDPGDQGQKVKRYIDEAQLNLKGILLTHGHFDHIGAVDYLYDNYHCPIFTHPYTLDLLKDSYLNLSQDFGQSFTLHSPISTDIDNLTLAGINIQWLLLEGHCQGSSMIYIPEGDVIFSGDVLFKGSIGRYDFPTSSHQLTKQTLVTLKNLRINAQVLPGHGDATTLEYEQQYNPYLR